MAKAGLVDDFEKKVSLQAAFSWSCNTAVGGGAGLWTVPQEDSEERGVVLTPRSQGRLRRDGCGQRSCDERFKW